jgi:ribose transport system substrate-binding protein
MLKWIVGLLIGMLLVVSFMFGKLTIGSDLRTQETVSAEHPKHHLQVIIQNTDEYFWKLFQEGAKAAGEDYDVYVELVGVSKRNTDELREAVEMAVNAGVDGIALQAVDSEQTQSIIESAQKQGMAVLTYENDNYIIPNTPKVGSNSYTLGCTTGDMAVKASDGSADVAVIINNSGNQNDEQYTNMIVQGILDSFSTFSSMQVDKIYTINADLFEAEKIATSIIEDASNVNLIICIDERSTPGIAQILVDNNKVGDIKLIGYGNQPQTLNYIKRGVIYGSVCPNAYEIGYTAVQQLTQSLDGDQISDYTSTQLYTIDAGNVNQYSEDLKQDSEGAADDKAKKRNTLPDKADNILLAGNSNYCFGRFIQLSILPNPDE